MTYDLVVLGAGSGGYAAALRAAQLGLRVALVEADKLGGTCVHRGCIPAKALLHAAEVADAARQGPQLGIGSSVTSVDATALNAYSRGVVERLYSGLSGLITARRIDLITGSGRLVHGDEGIGVQVAGKLVRGRAVVLATGSQPRTLDLPVDGRRIVTSDQALWLDPLPSSAVVLGGGVIGVELASAWRSLGVQVTLVEAMPSLMPGEEPIISRTLERAFRGRGIEVLTGAPMRAVTPTDSGVQVDVEGRSIEADLVLVAVGRAPRTEGSGFTEAGVALDAGWVRVDDTLATTLRGVWAVGDIVRGPQLAHRGFAQGIYVAERIAYLQGRLNSRPTPPKDADLPRVTYCDPEIVSVGLTEAQAKELGDVESGNYPLTANGRAQILQTHGLVRIVRLAGGPVVGVHAIGARISELAGEAQLAVAWDAVPEDLASLVHAHPTLGEALGETAMLLAGRPLHIHG